MTIPAKAVQALRNATGAGVMDVKKALTETKGDEKKAAALLKKRGLLKAAKKTGRDVSEGIIHSYIHGNQRIGVLLELNCETDFVARNQDFIDLANDLCLQIAANNPVCVELAKAPKGADPAEAALLAQPFVKDPEQTVEDVVKQAVIKLGENIQIARFTRYEVGLP